MLRHFSRPGLMAALCGLSALGQATINQKSATANCSNIVALTGNVTLNCATLSAEQEKAIRRIPELVNRVIESSLDPGKIIEKLAEMEQSARTQSRFVREWDRPLTSAFMIASLKEVVHPDFMIRNAVVVQLTQPDLETRNSLSFGVTRGTNTWYRMGASWAERPVSIEGFRCAVWTFPKEANEASTPTSLDELFIRPSGVSRLEAGAIASTFPFRTVAGLDHAQVSVQATAELAAKISKLTIVANDFVVFEIRDVDLTWEPVQPAMFRVMTGKFEQGAFRGLTRDVRVDPNQHLPEGFRDRAYYRAVLKSRKQPTFPMSPAVDLASASGRPHRITTQMSIRPSAAGSREQAIEFDGGWLPPED